MKSAAYSADQRGNWMLAEVVSCAMEILGLGDAEIAAGVNEFLQYIRKS